MNDSVTSGDLFTPALSVASQYSEHEKLVLIQSDTSDALAGLPSGMFSLIVTSPPYNLGKNYERQTSLSDYLDWQEKIIGELARLLKPNGSICWQVGNFIENGEVFPLDIYFYPIFKRLGLQLRNRIVWHFEHGLHASLRCSGRYETLLWFTNGSDYTFNLDAVRVPAKYPGKRHFKGEKRGQLSGNPLGKNPSDFWRFLSEEWAAGVWEIPNVKANHPEKTIHPCQFPVELVERCVLAFSNEDEWVLDPFVGVGSTMLAAAKNNRRALGIDRDENYCNIARQRIKEFQAGNIKIRPIGKPIHTPSGKEKVAQMPIEWIKEKNGKYTAKKQLGDDAHEN